MIGAWIDPVGPSFPFQDEVRDGESGQGYALRMAHGNGLSGLARVKQLLGKTHSSVLDASDAVPLAQWFGGSVQLLEFSLERLNLGRREAGSHYAGHPLGRSYFLTRSFPRVCPDCLRELGYCRTAWDLTLSVACVRHRRVLLDRCPSCLRTLSWNRPGLEACSCGYPLSMSDAPEEATTDELLVAHVVDQRMGDHAAFGEGCPMAESEEGVVGVPRFASLLRNLSLDGVMRIIYALATAAMYDAEVKAEKRERGALMKARQTIALAAKFGAKVTRLEAPDLQTRRPSVLIDLLSDVASSSRATSSDASLARSMLGWLMVNSPTSTLASRHASLSQMELF